MLDRHVIKRIIILAVLIISVIPVIYATPSTATTHVEVNSVKSPEGAVVLIIDGLVHLISIQKKKKKKLMEQK